MTALISRLFPCRAEVADARRQYTQQLDWNVVQSQNIAEGLRQVEALRAALIRLLWLAIADRGGCSCDDGWPEPTDLCQAWRALGFEGHFDADEAEQLLPIARSAPLSLSCTFCGGRGRLADHPCGHCSGSGKAAP